jgi:serine acetyltransferase
MTHRIHPSVRIHPTARIDCDELVMGAGGVVGRNCRIEGTRVEVGRDLWMDEGTIIGGGSCHDPCAFLRAGHFLHLGLEAQINIGRGVTLGDEVGVGHKIFTHGAYLSEIDGFPCSFAPVTIGSRVWLPFAKVHPGVTIGDDVVVRAGSIVTGDLPSGCLAGGVPCKVLREHEYPKKLSMEQRQEILVRIAKEASAIEPTLWGVTIGRYIGMGPTHAETQFDAASRTITGPVTKATEVMRNQLRRHGIRFRYEEADGQYVPWESP